MNRQMEEFSVISNDNFLVNMVDKPTRGCNILDIMCTNDPDCCLGTEITHNVKFSDHNLVSIMTNLSVMRTASSENNLTYVTKIHILIGDLEVSKNGNSIVKT